MTSIHSFDPEPVPGTRGYYVVEIHEGDDDMYASGAVYDGAPNWALKTPESTHQDTTVTKVRDWAERYAQQFLTGPDDGDMSTCRNCGTDIEYDSGNQPPWTHAETGVSDCGPDHDGFHAEPEQNGAWT